MLSICGCRRPSTDSAAEVSLLSRVKEQLLQRDRILFALHLEGRVIEKKREAPFTFDYRAPDRMLASSGGRLSFDGERLYQLDEGAASASVTPLALSPIQRSAILAQLFSRYVPEGFRAPILPRDAVEAREGSHPRAARAVELRLTAKDTAEGSLEIHYWFRWPSLDFLEKQSVGPGDRRGRIVVTEELCDGALKLCVPKALEETAPGRTDIRTLLDEIRLNQPLPIEAFSLK